jgi:putative transposase
MLTEGPIPNTNTSHLLVGYSEQARTQALERFKLLQPHLEDGVALSALARQQGVPLRTMQCWLQRYRQHGLPGLCRRPPRPSHSRPARRIAPQLVELIEGLALRTPPPSAAAVHRQVLAVAQQHGWAAPSYRTVYGIIREIDPGLRTLAHEGAKVYQEAFDLLYRREATRPNEMWQADHCLLDIWLLDPSGKARRPWLTVILDDYSRAVAGYLLSFQAPSALQTALALRQAIWRKAEAHWHVCGIPDIFYTDHGSDFISRHMEQVSADIKMQLVFSHPGRPRGRGRIERFFNTVNQLFLCTQPGYTPPHTSHAHYTPPNTPSTLADTPILTLAEFEANWRTFLLEDYHQRAHSETGQAPQARWEAGGWLPRLPESLEQLDLLLLTVAKTRRVQQDGIRFQGLRYLDLTLAGYVGEDVTIRYDPRDMAEIRVYHQEQFVCRAVCQEIAEQTLSLKEIIAARRQRRKELREQLSSRETAVKLLLEVHQPPVELQQPAAPSPLSDPSTPRLKRYYNE